MSNLVVMHLVFRVTIIVLFIAGPEAALNLHQSSLRSSSLEIFFVAREIFYLPSRDVLSKIANCSLMSLIKNTE